jgi:hypothetical protein
MGRGVRERRIARGLAMAVFAAVGVGAVASVACITVPPPDLPAVQPEPPTVLRASVVPNPAVPLTTWPAEFSVPVRVASAGDPFEWELIVDSNFLAPQATGSHTGETPDGGVVLVPVKHPTQPSTGGCPHLVQFIVAHSLPDHIPDSLGSDEVDWTYAPGGTPFGCPTFDAGDGSSPEASSDAMLPLAPVDAGALQGDAGGDP